MIQRKDTMGYTDFIRGKYTNDKSLQICLNEMTYQEKKNLLTKSFDELWKELWINPTRIFKNEYENAKKKFLNLNISDLIQNSSNIYNHSEFGFPKGRRGIDERNIDCAMREFQEETGYNFNQCDFVKYPLIKEDFTGTNGINYKHIYYLAKMKEHSLPPIIEKNNKEVKNIGWFDYDECIALLRPYDIAKKEVLTNVFNDIVKMNNKFKFYTPKNLNFYNNNSAFNNSFNRDHNNRNYYKNETFGRG